jgi:hypothetical protein
MVPSLSLRLLVSARTIAVIPPAAANPNTPIDAHSAGVNLKPQCRTDSLLYVFGCNESRGHKCQTEESSPSSCIENSVMKGTAAVGGVTGRQVAAFIE